jgi:broad specificity phosphatase PhoE
VSPDEVDHVELAQWFTDPAACPHGGESVAAFIARLGRWLARHQDADLSAVVAPGTAQGLVAAALGVDFWSIEVAPAVVVDLEGRGSRWRLRLT